jgi:group I intron endonuclease
MPYGVDHIGIYKIVNMATGTCYVGQSQRMKKRVHEHFRLLRLNKHPNPKLQNSYNKYGADKFKWEIEVYCEDTAELDKLENAFLTGAAKFVEPVFFNIAHQAKAPMRGKCHNEEIRKKISIARRASTFNYQSEEYRKTLSKAQNKRLFENKKFRDKIKFIVDNPHMSYAERGRVLGADISSVRRLALKYSHLQGEL